MSAPEIFFGRSIKEHYFMVDATLMERNFQFKPRVTREGCLRVVELREAYDQKQLLGQLCPMMLQLCTNL